MSAILGVVDYVVIGVMLSVSAAVGLYFRFTGGQQKTTDEFLMGGKNMSIFPVAFSLMATCMSAISILGNPSEVYMYGAQISLWVLGLPVGGLIVAYGLLPAFYEMQVSTVYEYLEKRFGKVTRTIASVLFSLHMVLYMTLTLYAPSLALNAVTNLSTWTSVITLTAICTFYCFLGGLKAVLWTDVFQATLMYVCVIALVIKGTTDMNGIRNVIEIANKGERLNFSNISFDFTERYTVWNTITNGVFFSLCAYGTNQAQVQRLLSVGNLRKAQIALILSVPLTFIFKFLCYLDGIVIYSYFHDCDPLLRNGTKISAQDQLVPYTVMKMFGYMPGLSGLCIAGIFSASLSTISSGINSLTAATMEDFIRPFCSCKRLTLPWATILAKVIAIAYGGMCLLLTYVVANIRGILEGGSVVNSMIGGPMLGIFSLGMFTTTANESGILIGLFVGFLMSAWLGFGTLAAKFKIPSLHRSTEACPVTINNSMTFSQNASSLLDLGYDSVTEPFRISNAEDRYILPFYKIAYYWHSLFGFLVVFIIGYVASNLIGIWKKYPPLNPINYSPFVRKFYAGTSKSSVVDRLHSDVEMKSNLLMHNDKAL